jgi:hypothetical protein
MNEAEWLECSDPTPMLEYDKQWEGSGRKQRLFACACCRQVADLLADTRCLEAVQTGEQFVEGTANADEVVAAFEVTYEIAEEQHKTQGDATVIADLANLTCQEGSEIAYFAYLFLLDLSADALLVIGA